MKKGIRNLVVVSDTHIGSSVALAKNHKLDDGGWYFLSPLQKKIWALWNDFWEFAYKTVGNEPFAIIHNGDITDGLNKMRTSAITTFNLSVQGKLAIEILKPHVDKASMYFQIRGTEAHAGMAAENEEAIAAELGATPDEHGNFSRWELWMRFGKKELLHFAHHISSTVSTAYESSAPMREMVAAFTESGQHRLQPPTLLVRSHRHRFIQITAPGGKVVTTPAWQLRTPYVHRLDRLRAPQLGGLILKLDDEDNVQIKERLYFVKENRAVVL